MGAQRRRSIGKFTLPYDDEKEEAFQINKESVKGHGDHFERYLRKFSPESYDSTKYTWTARLFKGYLLNCLEPEKAHFTVKEFSDWLLLSSRQIEDYCKGEKIISEKFVPEGKKKPIWRIKIEAAEAFVKESYRRCCIEQDKIGIDCIKDINEASLNLFDHDRPDYSKLRDKRKKKKARTEIETASYLLFLYDYIKKVSRI